MNLLSEIGQVQHRLSYFGSDFDACNIRVNIETTREHLRKNSAQSNQLIYSDAISTAALVRLPPSMRTTATNIPWSRHVFWKYANSVLGIKIRLCVCVCLMFLLSVPFFLCLSSIFHSFSYLSHCRLLCTKLSFVGGNLPKRSRRRFLGAQISVIQ